LLNSKGIFDIPLLTMKKKKEKGKNSGNKKEI